MASDFSIKTARIGLRHWQDSDIEPFIKLNADPQVMEFFPATLSPDETLAMIDRLKKHLETHQFGFWAAELLDTNQFMGFIGIGIPRFEASFTPCVEIGWRLSSEFWGKGLATEGAKACLNYGFKELNLPQILSFTTVANQRSKRVMEKIGMRYVQNFMHPNVPADHPMCEHVLYQILNPERK